MAGFEGADHCNVDGLPLDMVGTTGHAARLDDDYRALAARGVRVVRESLGWRLCEPAGGGKFNFERAVRMAQAASDNRMQVLWTLMHYGMPPDANLMEDAFCDRFADFACAAARALAPHLDACQEPVFTPINEISFLAWAACETNLIHPHVGNRNDPRHVPLPDGYVVKCRLVRACLLAMAAIRAELPSARFLHVDPLVHVVAPRDATAELAAEAARFREFQWQTWDLLCGRLEPELGGHPAALDLLGINHYPTAQWEFATGATLPWGPEEPADERRVPLAGLLQEAWQRYRRPILIAETGHCDDQRANWLRWVAQETRAALAGGVEVAGVCLYPIVDRPDWNDATDWHRCGLWDATSGAERMPVGPPGRHCCVPLDETLALCIAEGPEAYSQPAVEPPSISPPGTSPVRDMSAVAAPPAVISPTVIFASTDASSNLMSALP
ncbi:MAG: hypothetical protein ABIP94_13280 [Planctomycetota bacterium]